MVSFDNTQIAFISKSDSDLRKSFFLFKVMSWPTLVKYGGGLAPLGLKFGFKSLIKNTIFKQFVGGENITDCGKAIEQLAKYNINLLDNHLDAGQTVIKNYLSKTGYR